MTDVQAPLSDEERPFAGEYVLGVLDAAERAEAERRIAAEPAFARAVSWWETHLIPLAAEIGAVQPSAGLWPRISNLIGGPAKPSAMNNVRLWQGLSAGAVAVAAAALVFVALPKPVAPPVVTPAPTVVQAAEVAIIGDPTTKQPRFVATLDHATDELVITPVNLNVPTGRDAELWIIPEGAAPISLGVVPKETAKRLAVPPGLKAAGTYTATLAVTDEPLGGSPTGAPTGSIRAAGKFARA
ncbi:anti-sigma factor [Caulobacter soli]|uniref:anti-sigma factor n=1 Tax=Caulobacter soli TaxID=2708539 RepID=UPI0013EADAC4|nr:anti-sigma factor [Caulobacter soli]